MKIVTVQRKIVDEEDISRAEKVLLDNGIDPDEVDTVLQAVGYALLDTELYPENED